MTMLDKLIRVLEALRSPDQHHDPDALHLARFAEHVRNNVRGNTTEEAYRLRAALTEEQRRMTEQERQAYALGVRRAVGRIDSELRTNGICIWCRRESGHGPECRVDDALRKVARDAGE